MSAFGGEIVVSPGMSAPDVFARATYPAGVGSSGYGADQAGLAIAFHQLGYSEEWREEHVSHDTALTYSAVWACVRVISQSLAGLGWNVYERRPEDPRFKLPLEYEVAWLLGLQTGPEHSAFSWREVMLKDALVWGNGYSEIERTQAGRPYWMHYLAAGRVRPVRDDAARLWYEVDNGPGEEKTYLPPENVYHLKGPSPDGLVGWDMVSLFRRGIKLGLLEERYGEQFFSKGPMPGGTVTIPRSLTDEQRKQFRRSFEEVYSGSRNMHRLIVLSDGVVFNPASLPNDSAQFLESRRFQVSDVCRIYGVPPHKLADLERATFSNVEEQERAFVTDCLLPWARRLETEADLKLFGPVNRGRRFTKLNLDALMRGNSATQTSTVAQKVNSAILTINEAREYFDLNPIEDGDTPLIQGAMIPLADAVSPPEPPEPGMPPGAEPPDEGGPAEEASGEARTNGRAKKAPAPAQEARVRPALQALLTEAYARLLRVDADKALRARRNDRAGPHLREWYAMPEAARRTAEVLGASFRAAGAALRLPEAETERLLALAAERHVEACRADLLAGGPEALAEAGRPARAAERELSILAFGPDQKRDDHDERDARREKEDREREARIEKEMQQVEEQRKREDAERKAKRAGGAK